MKSVKVISLTRVTNETYDGYNFIVENNKGVRLQVEQEDKMVDSPLRFTNDYVTNILNKEEIPLDILSDRQVHRILKSATIEATIEFKKEGEDFVADEFTKAVKVDDEYVKPEIGQTYQVAETGYRIDYSQPVLFHFDDELVDNLIEKAEISALRKAKALQEA